MSITMSAVPPLPSRCITPSACPRHEVPIAVASAPVGDAPANRADAGFPCSTEQGADGPTGLRHGCRHLRYAPFIMHPTDRVHRPSASS
ncbi:hypothetical protein [Streptomyces sp. NPDC004284]|uniref:hypothetical protein n=1 Tax=Streptomyces sp. NPDC004284 TaxID=3364695 RepID=UPI00367BD67D